MGKGSKASLGCLFWIALLLLVVVIFLFNQNNIAQLIDRIKNPDDKKPPAPVVVLNPGESEKKSPKGDDNITITVDNPVLPENREKTDPPPSPAPSPVKETEKTQKKISKLYFVTVNNSDVINLTSVERQIDYRDAPLTETLATLIKGPTTSEVKSSITSLIPKGTELKSVAVKGDTAFISFNEEFRFNSYGVPGLKAQLKQIVYTATEFSNVARVQILIDGKKVDYLAQEGVFIGAPLSRKSF